MAYTILAVNSGSGSGTYITPSTRSISAYTAPTGYKFSYWSKDAGDAYCSIANSSQSSTTVYLSWNSADEVYYCSVTAHYTLETYHLIYYAGTGGTISGDTHQHVLYHANGTEVTAVANAGYEFTQWSDGTLTESRTDHCLGDDNNTAQFTYTGTTYPSSKTGGLTPSASLAKKIYRTRTGGLTPASELDRSKLMTGGLTAGLTPAGAISSYLMHDIDYFQSLDGTVASDGGYTRVITNSKTGLVTSLGIINGAPVARIRLHARKR